MEEKINLGLFKELFGYSSSANYAKILINTTPNENKEILEETEYRISDLEDRIETMS